MKADINSSYQSDVKTSFLPFMLAATDKRSRLKRMFHWENVASSDLTTIYEMLQFSPDAFIRMPQKFTHDNPLNDKRQKLKHLPLIFIGFLCCVYQYYYHSYYLLYLQSSR